MRAGLDTTNNMSEGCHNGFLIVVAKHHPDLCFERVAKITGRYRAEAARTNSRQVDKRRPQQKWYESKERVCTMVLYKEHVDLVANSC